MGEASLYDRLGGVFAIAAVIERFSDALISNAIVGQGSSNPELREVAAELARTLDVLDVPPQEKEEVLAAFAAHKAEVTEGSMTPA